jgi:hypothetical protein
MGIIAGINRIDSTHTRIKIINLLLFRNEFIDWNVKPNKDKNIPLVCFNHIKMIAWN